MTPIELVVARLDEHGCAPRRNGDGWQARCPTHQDRNPSLSASEGAEERALVHCHAGCETADVCAAIGLTERDLFVRRNGDTDGERRRIDTVHPYVDKAGELLYEVVRYQPKDFRQRRPDGKGGHIWRLGDTRRVLYRLPEVLAAVAAGTTVFVVEGEKDAEALEAAGYVATCNPAGAGKWSKVTDAPKVLTGGEVLIVADKDEAGYRHARDVARSLIGHAASILVAEPAIGNDVAEHLGAGRTVDDLLVVAGTANGDPPLDAWLTAENATKPGDDVSHDGDVPGLDVVDWGDLFAGVSHEDPLIDGVALRGRWTAHAAKGKVGKSTYTIHLAVEAQRGRDPFDGTPRDPLTVMYVDAEMGRVDMRERLEALELGPNDLRRLHYIDVVPNLDTLEGSIRLITEVERRSADIVIIDGINGACGGGENDDTTWRAFYNLTIAPLKRAGVAIITNDNLGKDISLGPRGSSVKVDKADAVIQVARTDSGIQLKTTHRRTAAYPLETNLMMHGADGSEPIRYRHADHSWPAGTAAAAAMLDRLGVPADAGRDTARRYLADARRQAEDTGNPADAARFKVSTDVLRAAVKYRRTAGVELL